MKTTYKYQKLRKEFFDGKNKYCQARLPGCTVLATDVHHTQGGSDRCVTLEQPETWIAVCRNCHNKIHDNSQLAKDLGFSK